MVKPSKEVNGMKNFSDFIVYVDESGDANWKAADSYPLLCVNLLSFQQVCLPKRFDTQV